MGLQRKTRVDGIVFGEGPRWCEGRLWFSNMHAQVVMAAGLAKLGWDSYIVLGIKSLLRH